MAAAVQGTAATPSIQQTPSIAFRMAARRTLRAVMRATGEGGGHGISAGTVHALGSSNSGTRLTATGGAASLYDQGASGGCGILAAVVYVSADAIIRGGDGNVAAPAIFFRHGCEIGCANVELYGGKYSTGSYAKPIQFSPSSDQTWYYHPHTTANAYGGHYSITVNRYRLTLVGNGGWYGGATFTGPDRLLSVLL